MDTLLAIIDISVFKDRRGHLRSSELEWFNSFKTFFNCFYREGNGYSIIVIRSTVQSVKTPDFVLEDVDE